MQPIFNFIAYWYSVLIELTHLSLAFQAVSEAASAGYDRATRQMRANEAVGLKMLEDVMIRELRISAVRELTEWEITRTVYVGARAGTILRLANWDSDRIRRKVAQIEAQLQEETQGIRA